MIPEETEQYCYYSDLPSPQAYASFQEDEEDHETLAKTAISGTDTDRIIEMAWEDRTPFDAIKAQFGLNEQAVKALMKKHLRFGSYKRWRKRVESCGTKHEKKRSVAIRRFRSTMQRTITVNKISKR